jgi:hypothetical protein
MAHFQHNLTNMEETPFYRREDFYSTDDTIRFSGMSMRKFFDQDRGQNYVFWMKENRNFNSANATYGNSHQKVSAAELPDLIEIIDSILKEIDSTHYRDTLPRFKNNPHALVLDRTTTEYWDLSLAQKLNSDSLFIRPCKMKDGTYSIRILAPRTSTMNAQWNGICVSLTIGAARIFRQNLEKFNKEIERESRQGE